MLLCQYNVVFVIILKESKKFIIFSTKHEKRKNVTFVHLNEKLIFYGSAFAYSMFFFPLFSFVLFSQKNFNLEERGLKNVSFFIYNMSMMLTL